MDEQISDRETILAQYADGPRQLEAAIAGLSQDQLDTSESDDTWTIRQIVHHLADGDDIWKVFVKRAIGNTGGEFDLAWYWEMPQDEWVESWRYASRAIEPSLALFRSNRAHIVQLLKCVPDAWERSIPIHWPNGKKQNVSVGWVVEMQARHVTGHLEDIRKILSGGTG